MNKICGIYKITNTITGDFYIGSSKDINRRWTQHKRPSRWNDNPNNPLYLDMRKYGIENFVFEVIEEAEENFLKEKEQQFIEMLKPTYNQMNAKGLNIERQKEYKKEYHKTEKYKEYNKKYEKSDKRKKYKKEYNKSDKRKKYNKEYQKSDKRKKYNKEYNNQLCFYNGEILTLCALSARFRRAGIPHPQIEAKKYLLQ